MSSTQQPILVLVVQATNLPGKKDNLEKTDMVSIGASSYKIRV